MNRTTLTRTFSDSRNLGALCQTLRQPRRLLAALTLLFCLATAQTQAVTVAYWQFQPGDPGADSSGNGNTLTLNNVTTSTDVPANAVGSTGSLIFNGTSSYAVTASTLNLAGAAGVTVECFVKTNGQSTLGMVWEDSANNNNNAGGIYLDFNEVSGCIKSAQGRATFVFKQTPFPHDSSWHHYAVTYSEPTGGNVGINLYIDGILQVTNISGNVATKPFINYPFYLGSRGGTTFFFNGKVGEMRISNRVLPPDGFLIAAPFVNAAIGITQQPTNTSVLQNTPVTLSVGAAFTNGDPALLEYQWQTNGVAIPGATASTYSVALAPLAYNGLVFSVVVSAPSVASGMTPVTSSNATLTVTADTTPAVATACYAEVPTMVGVFFNKLLDPAATTNAALYSLASGATVQNAMLEPDGKTVVLLVSALPGPTDTLSFAGVGDLSGNLATNSIAFTNGGPGLTIQDIGSVPPAGGVVFGTNATTFTVVGGGSDIFTAADGFNFFYTSLSGNFDVRLQINNVSLNVAGGSASTRGGLMVREDTTTSSRNVCIGTYVTNTPDWFCTLRYAAGATTAINTGALIPRAAGFSFPNAWVRLTLVGQTVTAYFSTNNLDWTQYGSNMVFSPNLAGTLLVGIASDSVSAVNSATFKYSDFHPFTLTNGTINITSQPTNTTVLAYTPATFKVSAVLLGNSDQTLLGYQWLANGSPVDGANAPTFTIPLPAVGDSGTQVRCTVSAPGVAPVSSAAATLTVTPDTNPPVVLYAYSLESHLVAIGFNKLLDPNTANNPGLYSLDGGFNVQNAQLQADGKTVLLTVDGCNAPQFNVTLSGIADLSGNLASYTVQGNNSGFTSEDINGGLLIPSQLITVSPGGFTVSAAGTDIFGTQDSFNFIFEWVTNDFDVRLQFVGSSPLRNPSQRGGLMVRQDDTQGSPNVFVGTYAPGSGNLFWVVTERPTENATTPIDSRPTLEPNFAFPNAWVRLKRAGQQFSAYESLDGFSWVQLGTNITDLALPDGVMLGIASTPISTTPAQFQYANFGPTIPIPQLQIHAAGGNVLLSWPTNATGFSLQRAPALPVGAWAAVTNAPVQAGGINQVTLPLAASAAFYRLIH
jgi:hypothetical protein